ncbi:MAG: hypothetical protein ACQESF_05725 [Nanobdellota archaeon]
MKWLIYLYFVLLLLSVIPTVYSATDDDGSARDGADSGIVSKNGEITAKTPEAATKYMAANPDVEINYNDDTLKGAAVTDGGYKCESQECKVVCEGGCIIDGKDIQGSYEVNSDGIMINGNLGKNPATGNGAHNMETSPNFERLLLGSDGKPPDAGDPDEETTPKKTEGSDETKKSSSKDSSNNKAQENIYQPNPAISEPDYYLGSADYWETPNYKIINGKNIYGADDSIFVGSGESVSGPGNSFVVKDYSSSSGSFSVRSAKSVIVGSARFDDLITSSFVVEDGTLVEAFVRSSVDNNTNKLGGLDITTDKGEGIKLIKDNATGKYNITLYSGNGFVQDNYGKVVCVVISPGSRYRYVGGDYEPFGLYIPSTAQRFRLCLRTKESEHYFKNCTQCGIVDFVNNESWFNGTYEFEKRKPNYEFYTDIIDGKSAEYFFQCADSSINNSNVTFEKGKAQGSFSYFFIDEQENRSCIDVGMQKSNPYIFNQYHNAYFTLNGTMDKISTGRVNIYGPGNMEELRNYVKNIQTW